MTGQLAEVPQIYPTDIIFIEIRDPSLFAPPELARQPGHVMASSLQHKFGALCNWRYSTLYSLYYIRNDSVLLHF